VQKRFGVADWPRIWFLLTVTFDPARDTPARLAELREAMAGRSRPLALLDRKRRPTSSACAILFGLDAFPDEGLISHSTRTVVNRPTRDAGGEYSTATSTRRRSSAT
jgi:cytochrome oxidase Cu insertion factor (SCO1/SenC/PrrC family)